MKILDSSKSLSVLVSDSTNGLGTIQPLECTVTEELNGIYECEFTVLTTDKHYEDLKNSGLIKVEVGDGSEQIFRVYFISEPINFVVQIKAQHITYDLSKIVVKPFTATGAVNIKNQLVSHILGSYPFTTWTDITNTTSTFTLDIPRSFRECLGGYEGSVLDVLRCEYEWDNLTVKLHARRGADNGVRIAYGKNLTDFVQEQNNENVYDGVYGYAVVDEVTYEASNYFNKTGATTPKILNVDFSSDYETGQVPTAADLLAKATTYAQNNPIEVPNVNIKIDFVPLWQTEEYKDILQLERVSLGDTVHVYFDKLNVEASSRVIKTEWNVLTQKYDSIELGDAKANLNTIINDSVSTAVDEAVSDLDIDVGWLDTKAENMFKLIANGVGLHITKDSAGRIILHNDENLSRSKYQYMITAQGFMMSDDYGQEGSWRSGWTTSGDAYMNSLSTITLKALEIYGSYIEGTQIMFGDHNDKYILARPYDADNDGVMDGILFEGTGYVSFTPKEKFSVVNQNTSNANLNLFEMAGAYSPYINLINYSPSGGVSANELRMATTSAASYINLNNAVDGVAKNKMSIYSAANGGGSTFKFENYRSDQDFLSNAIYMQSLSTQAYIDILNYQYNSSSRSNANFLRLWSNSSGNSIKLQNYDANGTLLNSIDLNSDGTLNIHSYSTLYLTSSGRVDITSSGSQDIRLISADDIHIQATDKVEITGRGVYYNGTQMW